MPINILTYWKGIFTASSSILILIFIMLLSLRKLNPQFSSSNIL